jgi:uncharacterized protein
MTARLPLLLGLTLLALAIVVGSVAIGRGIRARGTNDTITVTGSAKQRIVSDYAIWDLSVASQRPAAAPAAAQVAGWTARVRAFLTAHGIRPSELTVQPATAQTVSGSDNPNQIVGYQVTRAFEVRSDRVAAVAAAAEASSDLVGEGVPLQAQPLQYVFTKLAAIRPRLLAAAVHDAQNRGRVLLGATGGKLGKLRGVDVGVFQVTSPNSTEVSDYGVYDTSTLRKDVTAVVNVTFALR